MINYINSYSQLQLENMSDSNVVSVHLMGGLGNQLFQLFACISYGLSHSRRIILPYSEILTTGTIRNTYWDTLFHTIKHMTTFVNTQYTIDSLAQFATFRENGYRFKPIGPSRVPNVRLYGYFQSPNYFQEHYDTICSLMNLPNQISQIRNTYTQYFTENTITVSMHFRIGDYINIQDHHPIMPVQYYLSALQHILMLHNGNPCEVLYFCEQSDIDTVSYMISQIKGVVHNVNFVRADNAISDWEQMLLMSNCQDNIIANSTFSWWGAYLNQTRNKHVCYPMNWFGPSAKHDVINLFPEDWQRIMW